MSALPAAVELTDEQRAAVEARGVVFVSAGAGTGKTRVLVERVARALERGIAPEGIVVVTYTERAAGELAERVRARLAGGAEAALAARVEISTIHGFCSRLLREHAFAAGVDPSFRVLAEAEAHILRAEAHAQALREAVDDARDETLDLLASYGGDELRRMLATVYDRLRAAGLGLDPRLPSPADLGAARAAAVRACDAAMDSLAEFQGASAQEHRERVARLRALCQADEDAVYLIGLDDCRLRRAPDGLDDYEAARQAVSDAALDAVAVRQHGRLVRLLEHYDRAYTRLKDSEGALDFEDLQLRALALLRDDDGVRGALHERVRELLVDEFQDTNRLQAALLDQVCGVDADRFYVGDEFQSIYRFRHADVSVFAARRDDAAQHFELRDNYRSRPQLLEVVNPLFEGAFGDSFRPLDAAGRFAGGAFDYPFELLVVDAGSDSRATEARAIARRVREIVDGGEHAAGDVVVLLRSGGDVGVYEQALGEQRLQSHSLIGRGYYARQSVLDVVAYLRLLRNRYDDLALLTVLASPLVGVSNEALLRMRRAARTGLFYGIERTLPEGLAEADLNLLRAFRQRYDRLVAASAEAGLEELCERIVSEHDFDLACLAQRDGHRRYANLRKLVRLAREYEALRGPDLPGFVSFVQSQAGSGVREAEAPIADEEGVDAVRLMTIHAAKGLEFPVVIVADCGRRLPTRREPVIALPDGRFGFRVPDATGALHDPAAYRRVLEAERSAELEEQRRLIYVAMTRAVDRLIVSGARGSANEASALGWLVSELGLDVETLEHGAPREHRLAGGVPLLVERISVPGGEAAEHGPPAESEQLSLLAAIDEPAVPGPVAELPELAPLPTAPLHVPAQLSYSALALHERCAYRYLVERVWGLPPQPLPPGRDASGGRLSPLELGDAVHVSLETDGQAELETRYPGGLAAADREAVADLVAAWNGSALAARVAALERGQRELPFAFAQGEVTVRGRIDVCGREPDGAMLVVDYKTNALDGREPEAIVAQAYAIQRCIYALAALRAGAPAVEVCFAFLERPEAPVRSRYTAADEPELAAALAGAIDRLRASSFEPSPSPEACAGCPALDRVCAGPRLAGWARESLARPEV